MNFSVVLGNVAVIGIVTVLFIVLNIASAATGLFNNRVGRTIVLGGYLAWAVFSAALIVLWRGWSIT